MVSPSPTDRLPRFHMLRSMEEGSEGLFSGEVWEEVRRSAGLSGKVSVFCVSGGEDIGVRVCLLIIFKHFCSIHRFIWLLLHLK